MWDLLNVSIPAVLLLPIIALGVVAWFCLQQTAKSSDVRRAEFQRLQRLAMEEHERAEREFEQDYARQRQAEPQGGDFRHRGQALNTYNERGNLGHSPQGGDSRLRGAAEISYNARGNLGQVQRREPEVDTRRVRQFDEEEKRRKQAELVYSRRQQAEADENLRKQAEAEAEVLKRREAIEDEIRRKHLEEQEWQRRRADLEAQAKREAEEEKRRQQDEEEKQRRWKEEEAHKHEVLKYSPRRIHPMSNLHCIVCQKPTKRRCSRCKGVNYCSRECQVQHWTDGHKYECRPHDTSSPRSSIDGDSRNYSDFLSPRSIH